MVQRLVTRDILIVKAQTATLKGVIESMTHSRLIHGNALLLIFALATAVANMGYPAVDAESRPLAGDPVQDARQPVVGFHATQRLPGLATAKPASDQGPVVIQVEVVDPDKKHLAGADVVVPVWYSRSSGTPELVVERARSNGEGRVRLEIARDRPNAKVSHLSVWAYQPGRAIATTSVLLTEMPHLR